MYPHACLSVCVYMPVCVCVSVHVLVHLCVAHVYLHVHVMCTCVLVSTCPSLCTHVLRLYTRVAVCAGVSCAIPLTWNLSLYSHYNPLGRF